MPLIEDRPNNKKFVPIERRPWKNPSLSKKVNKKSNDEEKVVTSELVKNKPKISIGKDTVSSNAKQKRNNPETNAKQTSNKREAIKKVSRNERVTDTKQTRNRTRNKRVTENKNLSPSIYSLHGNEKLIMNYIFKICSSNGSNTTPTLVFSNIATELNIKSKHIIRVSTNRLIKKGYLSKHAFKDGRGGWVQLNLPNDVYKEMHKIGSKRETERETKDPYSSSNIINNKNKHTYIDIQIPIEWDDIDYSGIPNMNKNHIIKIYETNNKLENKNPLTVDEVQNSIYALIEDVDNEIIKLRVPASSFLLKLFSKGESYVPQDNFKSPMEIEINIQLERLKERNRKRKVLLEEYRNEYFEEWYHSLSVEDKKAIIKSEITVGVIADNMLKVHYKEELWPSKMQDIGL